MESPSENPLYTNSMTVEQALKERNILYDKNNKLHIEKEMNSRHINELDKFLQEKCPHEWEPEYATAPYTPIYWKCKTCRCYK